MNEELGPGIHHSCIAFVDDDSIVREIDKGFDETLVEF